MLLVVTTVAFLVHIYSVAYMHGGSRLLPVLRLPAVVTFSMLILVLADNLLVLFLARKASVPAPTT